VLDATELDATDTDSTDTDTSGLDATPLDATHSTPLTGLLGTLPTGRETNARSTDPSAPETFTDATDRELEHLTADANLLRTLLNSPGLDLDATFLPPVLLSVRFVFRRWGGYRVALWIR
jgi:hypothetical protein